VDQIAARLHETFVAAYPGVVAERATRRGFGDAPGLGDAITAGAAWLDETLRNLLERPFRDQTRSPLEVFQEAMRFPNEALRRAGIPAPDRDDAARRAVPGDRYDLAPASSQDLGEPAWRAHLAWGAAKARSASRPAVGLLSADLMDRARIEDLADRAGYTLVVWAGAREVGSGGRRPATALVDLSHPDADDVIRVLAGEGVRVVAFGPHVDDFAMVRAATLGAAEAMPRARLFRSIPDLLPPVV